MHRSSVERVEPLQGVQRTSAAASAAFAVLTTTVILGALGVVAIFSVGVGFVLAALLALFAAVWHSPAARTRPR